MSFTYIRCEDGKVSCKKHFDDKAVEEAKLVLFRLFLETYNEECISVLLNDDALLEFLVYFEVNKDESDLKKWISNAFEYYKEIQSEETQEITNEEPQQLKENTMENNQTNQTTVAAVPVQAVQAPAPAPMVQASGFDWKSVGKTTGIFLVGAAVGVGGKLIWNRFFG